MPSMRIAVCGLLICGMASLAVSADKTAFAEKRFALPAGGSLVMKWASGWAGIAPPPSVPAGTVSFSGPDASRMRVLLMPVPTEAGFTSEFESLRTLTSNVARELATSGEVDKLHRTIEGPNMRGLYVKGVDLPPKPGEFSFIYSGAIAIDARPFVFQILWNAGGEANAEAALVALKTVRIDRS